MANHKGQSRRRSIRRRFKIVAFSFFLVIFLLSSTMALKTVIESSKAKSGYSELQALMRQEEYENTVVATGNEVEAAITNEMELNVTEKSAVVEAKEPITIKRQKTSVDFSALKEINPDIIGWIRAEGTNIDYPIAQTDNNEYYLSHLYNKEWNSSGTIFADYRNTVHKSARVCHLHGLFPPFRRRFSATLSGLLATQTVFLNNERGTSKNAVTTFKEVHRNDGLQENSYASKYGVQPTRNGTQ